MELLNFKTFSLVLVFVVYLSSWNTVESVTSINSTSGGYRFTIAIDDNVPEPSTEADLTAYIANIRSSLQRLTLRLFIATKGYFHIEEVQLLLPHTWNSTNVSSIPDIADSTIESYSNSDVRLSSSLTYPYVSNPHTCGLPGNYIELPFEFFQKVNDDSFGSTEKAFLTQWARFRWGVWEEHGYPDNERFPYFYKPDPNVEDGGWEATSCSDVAQLEGEFRDINGSACSAPDATCRFFPAYSPTNKPTSSLMGFHWVETVDHFCDEKTHNQLAPNKQNVLCDYRSVWEVIRSSPDFLEVEGPSDSVPLLKLNIVKTNPYPAFHLLIDRGSLEGDSHVSLINQILAGLIPLFDEAAAQTMASVYAFSSEGFTELVGWQKIGDNPDDFYKVIDYQTNYSADRDFTSALLSSANVVEELHPVGGAVVLVVKVGAPSNSFDSARSEEEVIAKFSQLKIKLFAAEIQNSTDYPFLHLRNLATRTSGSYTPFLNASTALRDMQELVGEIKKIIDIPGQEIPDPSQNPTHVLYQGSLAPTQPLTIVQPNRISQVKIYLTLASVAVPVLTVGGTVLVGTTRNEWDEMNDVTRRTVHTYDVPAGQTGNLDLVYTCTVCAARDAEITIVGQLAASEDFGDLIISTETNANSADTMDFLQTSSPLLIYTTVLLGHRPVTNVIVTAIVSYGNVTETFELEDNGDGSADALEGDGVYSGFFIPEANGPHRISVQVKTDNSKAAITNRQSRLLPIDQEQIGCPEEVCGPTRLDGSASYISNINDVNFVNSESFERGKTAKIRDLVAVSERHAVTGDMRLRIQFKSPKIIGVADTNAKSTAYYILGSNSTDIFSPAVIGDLVRQSTITNNPEETELFVLPIESTTKIYNYYVVHSVYSDFPTLPIERIVKSNVAQLRSGGTWEDPTTQEPTTTTTEGSTISTTPGDPGTGSSTTSEPEPEEDKAFFASAGGIVVIILIVLIAAGGIGGGVYYYMNKRNKGYKGHV